MIKAMEEIHRAVEEGDSHFTVLKVRKDPLEVTPELR